ncbi:MAG: rumA1 [Chlamydiales bacterium]|jgi:23S rRNA (uracil1939-C5)-methyltransferase|nr:rumA1 [Chlamydiales bacterium]
MKHIGYKAQVEVKGFEEGGLGVTSLELPNKQKPSKVVIPESIPGEIIDIELHHIHKKDYWAEINQMHRASPYRTKPECKHFGVCGGCRWQHMSYEGQLRYKQQGVYALFQPLLPSEQLNQVFHTIAPCESPWHYRNKMEFSFNHVGVEETPVLGLIELGRKQRVGNLTMCPISQPWMAEVLDVVRGWWAESGLKAYSVTRNIGALKTLTVRQGIRTGDKMLILTATNQGGVEVTAEHKERFVEALRSFFGQAFSHVSIYFCLHIAQRGQPTRWDYQHLAGPAEIRETLYSKKGDGSIQNLTFSISPSAFFQPNTLQAEKLYTLALEKAQIKPDNTVYDLYCGTATFGLFASSYGKHVYGVELNAHAVADGNKNIQTNGLGDRIQLTVGDVGEVLRTWKMQGNIPKPDVVLVDPPRAGLSPQALQHLTMLMAEKIVYLSCNPTTQAENVKYLLQAGYQIEFIQPVDQFPQTPHIENIVILSYKA